MTTPSDYPDVYRELFAAAPDGILLVGPDGVIRLANSQCGRILGCDSEQLPGRSIDDFVPLVSRHRHSGHRADFQAHPRTRPMGSGLDLSAQRDDGSRIPVEISLSPVGSGASAAVLAIVRDVSDRRAAEQTIHELSEALTARVAHLEVLNTELESFSYSVSHDLRAPLRAIDGFSLALLEDYGQELPAEAQHHLDRIRAGAQRMAQLIDDLLVLSRISRADLRINEVDVSGLAGVVLRGLQQSDPDRDVEAEIEPGLRLRGDIGQLRLVLENLLDNAWKFTSKQAWTHISIRGTTMDGEPAVVVSDNGAGFDEQYSDQMFGAFQRLHSAAEFPGTGVGLAIVQRIVLRHGGRITAGSHPGAGATFVFRTTSSQRQDADAVGRPGSVPEHLDSEPRQSESLEEWSGP